MSRWLLLLCVLAMQVKADQPSLRLGVMAHTSDLKTRMQYAPLGAYLAQALAPIKTELVFVSPEQLSIRQLSHQADFLLADPYIYLMLRAGQYLPAPLLSQTRRSADGQSVQMSGVIFCLKANPLCDLSQLSKAQIASSGEYSLGGYAAQRMELQQLGIVLEARQLRHAGSAQEVIDLVLDKVVDLGFVRSGALEDMYQQDAETQALLQVLNPQQLAAFPFEASTRLYPEWPLLVMPGVPAQWQEKLVEALLQFNLYAAERGLTYGFSAPAEYSGADYALQTMQLAPYHRLPPPSAFYWLHLHALYLLAAVCVFLLTAGCLLLLRRHNRLQQQTMLQLTRNRDALQQQQMQLHAALNSSKQVLFIRFDSQGRILSGNHYALRLLSPDKDHQQQRSVLDWLHDPQQQTAFLLALHKLQTDPMQTESMELCLQLKQGELLYLDADLSLLPAEASTTPTFAMIGTDVSRRKAIKQKLQKSVQRLDQLLEQSPAVILAFDPKTMQLTYISPNCFTLHLKSAVELLRTPDWWQHSIPASYREGIEQQYRSWVASNYAGLFKYSYPLARGHAVTSLYRDDTDPSYSQLWVETQLCAVRDEHGTVTEITGSQIDVTENQLSQMKRELAASVFTTAREGIFITNSQGTILDLNSSFCRITGYTEAEAVGRHISMLGGVLADDSYQQKVRRQLMNEGFWEGELQGRRKSGEAMVLSITMSAVRDAERKVQHFVALFSDITQHKVQEEKLRFIAHYDSLTGLPNRLLLTDRIEQSMSQAKRKKTKMAVIFIDLDGFKSVNDSLGHEAGDYLLIELANRMRAAMRDNDTLARLGGDEFIALITELASPDDAIPFAERLLTAASNAVQIGGHSVCVSASIGISFYPQAQAADAACLLRQADLAMYQAKRQGKNQYYFWHPTIEPEAHAEPQKETPP
ncbi:diguanylate cyclase [Rheinheimera sp.]|uniref:diguanylate cyclase domain-containing protein n=1 Tax=Rheinheimera sp. TaxID=1869214 RepID=UPI00307EA4D0